MSNKEQPGTEWGKGANWGVTQGKEILLLLQGSRAQGK